MSLVESGNYKIQLPELPTSASVSVQSVRLFQDRELTVQDLRCWRHEIIGQYLFGTETDKRMSIIAELSDLNDRLTPDCIFKADDHFQVCELKTTSSTHPDRLRSDLYIANLKYAEALYDRTTNLPIVFSRFGVSGREVLASFQISDELLLDIAILFALGRSMELACGSLNINLHESEFSASVVKLKTMCKNFPKLPQTDDFLLITEDDMALWRDLATNEDHARTMDIKLIKLMNTQGDISLNTYRENQNCLTQKELNKSNLRMENFLKAQPTDAVKKEKLICCFPLILPALPTIVTNYPNIGCIKDWNCPISEVWYEAIVASFKSGMNSKNKLHLRFVVSASTKLKLAERGVTASRYKDYYPVQSNKEETRKPLDWNTSLEDIIQFLDPSTNNDLMSSPTVPVCTSSAADLERKMRELHGFDEVNVSQSELLVNKVNETLLFSYLYTIQMICEEINVSRQVRIYEDQYLLKRVGKMDIWLLIVTAGPSKPIRFSVMALTQNVRSFGRIFPEWIQITEEFSCTNFYHTDHI